MHPTSTSYSFHSAEHGRGHSFSEISHAHLHSPSPYTHHINQKLSRRTGRSMLSLLEVYTAEKTVKATITLTNVNIREDPSINLVIMVKYNAQ